MLNPQQRARLRASLSCVGRELRAFHRDIAHSDRVAAVRSDLRVVLDADALAMLRAALEEPSAEQTRLRQQPSVHLIDK